MRSSHVYASADVGERHAQGTDNTSRTYYGPPGVDPPERGGANCSLTECFEGHQRAFHILRRTLVATTTLGRLPTVVIGPAAVGMVEETAADDA
jgi:hypothetical protein